MNYNETYGKMISTTGMLYDQIIKRISTDLDGFIWGCVTQRQVTVLRINLRIEILRGLHVQK